ncbi:MAG: hypothetical protein LBO64_02105 [Desulfovibrio sp.]|nr:hypothetical protein [Desulfovibrio sp.]
MRARARLAEFRLDGIRRKPVSGNSIGRRREEQSRLLPVQARYTPATAG